MLFQLEFDMESAVTRKDVSLALKRVAEQINRSVGNFEDGDEAPIRNHKNEPIGTWRVSDE